MPAPLVSTVIPVFNRANRLRSAVASVLAQTWRPIEIVIVDDGSTDDTPQAIAELQARDPQVVRSIRQPNAGPGPARQRGADAARGDYIQFLDSDDLLLPRKFEMQVAALEADRAAGISYGKTYSRVHGERQPQPSQRTGERHRQLMPAILRGRIWETSTPLYRRSALEAIGPWSALRQLEDWEFDCRAGAARIELDYRDEFVAEYVHHDEGRLCHLWMQDPSAMDDRARAYVAVLAHAMRAGVPREAPEMREFVRSLFWMSRGLATYGLPQRAKELHALAMAEAVERTLEMRAFAGAAALVGWQRAGRLAEQWERWKP